MKKVGIAPDIFTERHCASRFLLIGHLPEDRLSDHSSKISRPDSGPDPTTRMTFRDSPTVSQSSPNSSGRSTPDWVSISRSVASSACWIPTRPSSEILCLTKSLISFQPNPLALVRRQQEDRQLQPTLPPRTIRA